ncbi:MAG: hypothetical protein HY978_00940, partial [Candidatus Liptonbacteria bacterium]|nr:hypothetical protein [Candidatus Liptonbacteria bacterium]
MNRRKIYILLLVLAAVLSGTKALALTTLNPPGGIWNSAGNVGIGTTGPDMKLNVVGAADSFVASFYGTGTNGILLGSQTTGTALGRISTNHAIPMTLEINGAEKVRIDSNGNVGIGTTGPRSKLDIGGGNIRLSQSYWNSDSAAIEFATDDGASLTNSIVAYSANSDGYYGFKFKGGSGTTNGTLMTITGQGNVGIGTT